MQVVVVNCVVRRFHWRDQSPSEVALEGAEPRVETWPEVERPTPPSERIVYPGAGSELFHGKKRA